MSFLTAAQPGDISAGTVTRGGLAARVAFGLAVAVAIMVLLVQVEPIPPAV